MFSLDINSWLNIQTFSLNTLGQESTTKQTYNLKSPPYGEISKTITPAKPPVIPG